MPDSERKGERVVRGIAVSDGVCRGKVLVLARPGLDIPRREVPEADLGREVERLRAALSETRKQIHEISHQVRHRLQGGETSIFEAHLMVLDDPVLLEEVFKYLNEHKVNVEQAFHAVSERFAATLAAMDDDYLRERVADIRDVSTRVLNNLLGRHAELDLKHLTEQYIIISHDLTPSTTAQLDKSKVLGFATEIGGKTSHTAIMARALSIPAVVGLRNITLDLETGEQVLLDGFHGLLIVNPTDQTLFQYGQLMRRQVSIEERMREVRAQPAVTLDGQRVLLSANVEKVEDVKAVVECGADGVGLFRTEYLFLDGEHMPGEDEQYEAYRKVAAALKPQPVVIRTLDLGGDKLLGNSAAPEANPFLGRRSIRLCLQEREWFCQQLRAILRASAEGNVKLMYPMISGLRELKDANQLVDECKAQLRGRGIAFDEKIEIGAMIEVPSAAVLADTLAQHIRFFSIGTNDLIQYTLAVDRLNESIAQMYEPTHPAILRLIKLTVDAAHKAGIPVGVCGESAGDPDLVPLLLGLGVDELSAAPPLVPKVKFLIRRLTQKEIRSLAEFALACESPAEILAQSRGLARQVAPDLFNTEDLVAPK